MLIAKINFTFYLPRFVGLHSVYHIIKGIVDLKKSTIVSVKKDCLKSLGQGPEPWFNGSGRRDSLSKGHEFESREILN